MNNQQPTSNAEHPLRRRAGGNIGRWALDVGCWMFLISPLSALAQTATNESLKLAPAYGEIPPTFWEQHGLLVVVTSVTLLALAGWAAWEMCRSKPVAVVPPAVLARAALATLQGQSEDGKQLSDVSKILRRYVVAAFDLPAAEMTTAEFCVALARNEKIPFQLGEPISRFLRECDERKFSTVMVTTPLGGVDCAIILIAQAEQQLASAGNLPRPAQPVK